MRTRTHARMDSLTYWQSVR